MTRRSFIVYPRRAGKRHASYYMGLLQPDGSYRRQALTDDAGLPITRKADAEAEARRIFDREMSPRGAKLAGYLSAFWAPGSAYLKKKAAAREPLSASYLANCRSAIKVHILPWLAAEHPGLTLPGVKPGHLEDLKQYLVDSGLGPARVNGIMKAIRVPLGDAWRREDIDRNPASKVKKLPDPPPKRRILEVEEARAFFAATWKDPRMFAANLTAALAGLRLGEIRGLQVDDIVETRRGDTVAWHLHVCHNWQDGEGMKGPKHHTELRPKVRDVPIPARLAEVLREVATRNAFADGFVLQGYVPHEPPSGTLIEESFEGGLRAIGITEEVRRARHLSFHAWRHFYNSHMRGANLPGYQLRMLTGHSDETMTDRYSAITDEQRAAVAKVASGLLE